MSNHPEDVDDFTKDSNGVVIDAEDLLVLNRRVAIGEITQEQARRIFEMVEGRLRLDSITDDEDTTTTERVEP